jgi:hypothetical protein
MGNTRNTGYLQNIVLYDANDNITLPARLAVTGTVAVNNTTPYDTTQFSLDVNGGLIVKNINKTAQFVLINSNPASGGNNAFVVHTVGGTSASSYADIQGYYGTSIAGSTVLRLNPQGGNVLVGSLAGTGSRMVVASATGVLSTQAIVTLGDLSGVPTSRTITINGTSQDLSTNRTFTLYTDDISEDGSPVNLWFTNARARAAISVSGSLSYDSATGVISYTTPSTSGITEGTNLYYTDTRVGTYLTNNSYATQNYVSTQINNLVNGAPGLLDTLDELAQALGDDPNFSTTVTTALSNRLRIDVNNQGLTSTQKGYGRTNLGVVIGTDVQAWDADLDAIAALSGTSGFLKKTAANTWSLDTNTYLTSYTETDPYRVTSVAVSGTSTKTITLTRADNSTVSTTWTDIDTDTNTYVTSAAFSGGTLTLTRNDAGTVSVSLDGRYLQSYTETDTLQSVILRNGNTDTGFRIENGNNTYSTPASTNVPVIYMLNTGSNASAHAVLSLRTLGGTGGDPFISLDINGVLGWHVGVDNSDGDKFKIGKSWANVGDNNYFAIDTSGNATFSNSVNITDGSLTIKGISFGGTLYLQSGTTTDNWLMYHYNPDNTLRFNYNGAGGDEFIMYTNGATTFSNVVTSNGFNINAGNSTRFYRGANDYYWRIHSDSNNFLNFGAYAAAGTDYLTNPKLLLHDNGDVGINVTPTERLHLRDLQDGYVGIRLEGSGTYAGSDWTIYASALSPSSADDFLGFYNNSTLDSATSEYKFRLFKTGVAQFQNNVNIQNGRLTLNTGGVNSYGLVSGYNNNNHLITLRANISGATASPTYTADHLTCFVEYAEANDSTGWFFKTSQTTNYTEVARITRSGINWNGNTVWHAGNDGSGSGLDADLLDGRDSGGYMTQIQGGIEFPTGSYTGWYKLARSSQASGGAGLRGSFKIIVAATGNYLTPTQDEITGFKDWTTTAVITSVVGGNNSIFQNYRITYDADYSYLEGYISYYFGGSQSIVINSYVNGLNGLTWSPYTGTAQGSSTSNGAVSIGKVGTGLAVPYLRSAGGIFTGFTEWVGDAGDDVGLVRINNTKNAGGVHYPALLVMNQYGNHSYGIVAEFRINDNDTGDRPSILFSKASGPNWAIGMGATSGSSNNFRIGYKSVYLADSWASMRMDMDTSGNVTFAGDVTAYSDVRLKDNIVVISDALEKIQKIRGVTFTRKDDLDNNIGRRHTGVIAQEVLNVLPEAVSQNDTGMYTVAYGNMAGLFIEAIKEQQTQIESQKSEIEELKDLVKQLINR